MACPARAGERLQLAFAALVLFFGGLRRRVVFLLALNFVSSSKQPLSLCFAHFCLFLSRSSEVIVLLSNQGQGEMPLTLAVGLETLKQKPEESWRTRPGLSYFSQILFSPCQCSRLGLNTAPELKPHCLWTVCLVQMNYSHFALSVLCPVLLQMLSRMAGNLEEKFRFFFFFLFFFWALYSLLSVYENYWLVASFQIFNPKPSEVVETLTLTLTGTNFSLAMW